MEKENEKGEGLIFSSVDEVKHALEAKVVSLHAKIKSRVEIINENNEKETKLLDTTAGRILISEILPKIVTLLFQ